MAKQLLTTNGLSAGVVSTFTSGTYVFSSISFDSTGRVSDLINSSGAGGVTSISGTPGRITVQQGVTSNISLSQSGVSAGTYNNTTQLTVDAYGRITSITSIEGIIGLPGEYNISSSITVNSNGYFTNANSGRSTNVTMSSPTINGTYTVFSGVAELYNSITGASGTVTHDFSTGNIWYHSSIASSFTANFTNIPTTDGYLTNVTLMLDQGSSPILPSVQINGAAQTVKWPAAIAPTAAANITQAATFTFLRISGSWITLGSVSNYS